MATSSNSQDWLDTTLNQAQPWISRCLSKHVECRTTMHRRIPTRLVDVGPSDGSKNPFLFVPAARCSAPPESDGPWTPTPDTSFRYLALSYCWGTQGSLMTTPENVDARRAGIAWDEIPQTIKEAILVTRKLGPRGDWATESPKIADVYGGAFLTISAAISPGVRHGFHQSLESPHSGYKGRTLRPIGNPLYLRGWALQERILSPRVLIFADTGLYWECQASSISHVVQDHQDKFFPAIAWGVRGRLKLAGEPGRMAWSGIVQDYSSRALTLERDKLPALSGVATLYSSLTKYDYLAGLWNQTLFQDLLWKTMTPASYSGNFEFVSASHSQNIAPSWSWASVNRQIMMFFERVETEISKVLKAQIEFKDPRAPFGEVNGGSIVLRGPLVSNIEVDGETIQVWHDGRTASTEAQHSQQKIHYMLLLIDKLGDRRGLVLEGGKGEDHSCFARIGTFRIWQKYLLRVKG
ncbi:HET domain containing protein [Hyaloscypha variabilis]